VHRPASMTASTTRFVVQLLGTFTPLLPVLSNFSSTSLLDGVTALAMLFEGSSNAEYFALGGIPWYRVGGACAIKLLSGFKAERHTVLGKVIGTYQSRSYNAFLVIWHCN